MAYMQWHTQNPCIPCIHRPLQEPSGYVYASFCCVYAMFMCMQGFVQVEFLLGAGASVSAADDDRKETPTHASARTDNHQVCGRRFMNQIWSASE